MSTYEMVTRTLPIALPVLVILGLRTLLLLSVSLTATWSRSPGRRRAALAVLRIIANSRADTLSSPVPKGTETEHRARQDA